mmetsp:Transcript_3670/g.6945  ORF Transcript_3670/g.6945 Transcript_3670/m.6945 type:complete len:217 (+) Transcript_3670:1008-1658(+)
MGRMRPRLIRPLSNFHLVGILLHLFGRHGRCSSRSSSRGIRDDIHIQPGRCHDPPRSVIVVHVHLPNVQTRQILLRTDAAIHKDVAPRPDVPRMVLRHRILRPGVGGNTLPIPGMGAIPPPAVVRMELPRGLVVVGVQRRGAGSRGGFAPAARTEGDFGERIEYHTLHGVCVRDDMRVCDSGGGFVIERDGGRVVDRCGGCVGVQVDGYSVDVDIY